ncbi:MAG TPA: MATE family efflux transporter [Candidatus Eisenbergiella merdipullorum]|uniref:Probable multidrug resistance protein NorM n=1 Tax=Candidatus Eisenbergiella merdipullorum TaxID=2838553 RepID=A0A9D2I893_9FIRM|nr:MATE family efflux transporter [Candidatus Eisenbergiella merdipullorum]
MEEDKTVFSFTGRQLRALIIPLVLEQVLGLTVGMADSVMVSSAGEAAVSGISLVDSINILLINTFNSLATGGAVMAARRLGEKRQEEAGRTADQLLLCVTGIALVIAMFSIALNRQILSLIFGKVEADVMENAVTYFYLTALSFPFLGIYNASAGLSRAMGNSKITMWISLMMNIVNIIGNAILIFGFGLGVFGAAFSTLVSRILGACVMFCILRSDRHPLHYSRRIRLRLDWNILRDIFKVGIPTGMDNCIFQVGKILVQSLVAGLGTTAIAANAIVGTVAGVAVIPSSAIGIAMITVVGQALGASAVSQAKYYVKKLMGYAYLFMAILNVGIILLSGQIAGMYQVTEATRVLAAQVIIFHSVCAMLFYPSGFALPNALRAAMDATYTMVISLGCMWIFRIGFSYLFVLGFHMGLMGIWAAMGVDWVVRSFCYVWRISSGKWMREPKG